MCSFRDTACVRESDSEGESETERPQLRRDRRAIAPVRSLSLRRSLERRDGKPTETQSLTLGRQVVLTMDTYKDYM